MVEAIERVILHITRDAMSKIEVFSLSCDEVKSCDNQSWIFVTRYIVQDWGRVPMFLPIEHVMEGASSNHLANVLINAMGTYDNMKEDIMCQCFINFGIHGASTL